MRQTLSAYLAQTARSFAVTLRIFPSDLRNTMGCAYALCRLADTITDTDLFDRPIRGTLLDAFTGMFRSFPLESKAIEKFRADAANTASPASVETRIFDQGLSAALDTLHFLPRSHAALCHEVVLGVARGMKTDLDGFPPDRLVALPDDLALDAYLESIGGEPGIFWSRLTRSEGRIRPADVAAWDALGMQIGKGLQMVNILRDLPEDLARSRSYIPESLLLEFGLTLETLRSGEKKEETRMLLHRLIDRTIGMLGASLPYLAEIPRSEFRMRVAVWWPVSVGLRTLARLRSLPDPLAEAKRRKISRNEFRRSLALGVLIAPFQALLHREFRYWSRLAESNAFSEG